MLSGWGTANLFNELNRAVIHKCRNKVWRFICSLVNLLGLNFEMMQFQRHVYRSVSRRPFRIARVKSHKLTVNSGSSNCAIHWSKAWSHASQGKMHGIWFLLWIRARDGSFLLDVGELFQVGLLLPFHILDVYQNLRLLLDILHDLFSLFHLSGFNWLSDHGLISKGKRCLVS